MTLAKQQNESGNSKAVSDLTTQIGEYQATLNQSFEYEEELSRLQAELVEMNKPQQKASATQRLLGVKLAKLQPGAT